MIVGFTGTSKGMTEEQAEKLRAALSDPSVTEFHHGACVGSDEHAAEIAHDVVAGDTVAHPGHPSKNPDDLSMRSQKAIDASDVVLPAKAYYPRDRDIVAACDLLIATPVSNPPPIFGGTTYTTSEALRKGKRVMMIWPDGSVSWAKPAPLDPVQSAMDTAFRVRYGMRQGARRGISTQGPAT